MAIKVNYSIWITVLIPIQDKQNIQNYYWYGEHGSMVLKYIYGPVINNYLKEKRVIKILNFYTAAISGYIFTLRLLISFL